MLKLAVPLCKSGLNRIKSELVRTLPEVKSSHRCEALARGVGYNTYAALLAHLQTDKTIEVEVDETVFKAYLIKHDFDVVGHPLYFALAREAIFQVQERHYILTLWGVAVGRRKYKDNGKLETSVEFNARFRAARDELVSDYAVKQFLLSLALIARIPKTKTIREGTGSYRLKHIAENYRCTYPDGDSLGPSYVANGAFIVAAVHAGHKFKTYVDELGYEDVNVSFNMSKSAIDELDQMVRPNRSHRGGRTGYALAV